LLGVISMLVRASAPGSDMAVFFHHLNMINIVLLIFNLLPIFPLDGGQIVRGLLWFPFGEIRSLQISSVIGLVGGAILGIVGLMAGSVWWAILAFFLLSRAWYGWQQAKAMIAMSRMQIPIPTSPSAPENVPPSPR
jgi:Zn-dependent protease